MPELSVLIPARNEMFLKRTVEDVLANARGDTEVIVVLDGAWADPPLQQHDRVSIVYRPESIGQRAATNQAARLSTARYVMKLDAHCSLGEGFDETLIEAAQDLGEDVTQIPAQYNFHVFDWVCSKGCGWRLYQSPTPPACPACGGQVEREIVWQRRESRLTTAWRFDRDLHFKYWGEWRHTTEGRKEIAETLSCLGACWFLSRERYWQLGGLDEGHGSWGQMGTEIACKSWLSGGRLVCNKRTWFAHLFRTQGGDFGFPYPLTHAETERAREHSKALWLRDAWPGAVHPLSWLIERFAPVPEWETEAKDEPSISGPWHAAPVPSSRPVRKGVVFYTDCRGDETILRAAREQLSRAVDGREVVSVALGPVDLGDVRVVFTNRERGYLTMFRQILAGLELSTADVVFLCEHDVLYHPSHFDFAPPDSSVVYYNENVWKVDAKTGRALYYRCRQTSGLCAHRSLLVEHYRRRVALVEARGFSRKMGFEPGTHGRAERVDNLRSETWMSDAPNVDIRHSFNLTPSRWTREEFRNARSCRNWRESDAVPGWGVTLGRFDEWLRSIIEACVSE